MAGLCTAAMVSSMVVPVWAADDAAEEETADDGDVADISEALIGIWQDSAGDIYGFYKDNFILWSVEGRGTGYFRCLQSGFRRGNTQLLQCSLQMMTARMMMKIW